MSHFTLLTPRLSVLRVVLRLAVSLLLTATVVRAQVVRGTVTEARSRVPLSGVVVELVQLSAAGSDSMSVGGTLSSADGSFAIRARGAGRFVLLAKRIGVRKLRSAPFPMTDGETVIRDLQVDAVGVVLPEIVVTGLIACDGNARRATRIAALWEEARTALYATQLSLRDSLFSASVTRYYRELDAKTRRVLNEYQSQSRGVVAKPFASQDAESLAVHGYRQTLLDGGTVYFGPDADVLLSESFLRTHCFREVRTARDRRGQVGIAFEPVDRDNLVDVSGTLWLDQKSYQLRSVDFRYSGRPAGADARDFGGEVLFSRLTSGAWFVRRWSIRLPITARISPVVGTQPSAQSWVLVRPTTIAFREEGGDVRADDLPQGTIFAQLAGTFMDTLAKSLPNATVRVSGTGIEAEVGTDGLFVLDSVPVGRQHLVFNTPGYDSLGLAAADLVIDVRARGSRNLEVRTHSGRVVYERMCFRKATRNVGAVRVIAQTDGEAVLAELPVKVTWIDTTGAQPMLRSLSRRTDDRGTATICEAPVGVELRVTVGVENSESASMFTLTLPQFGAKGVLLTVHVREH